MQAAAGWGAVRPDSVLEIGCGTGNHTLELAKLGIAVTALDIDAEMIGRAQRKLDSAGNHQVHFHHGPAGSLGEGPFDLALALFNVVTYILEDAELLDFFSATKDRLKPGGVFIFDCWNGDAALRDPPGTKETETIMSDKTLHCRVSAETDMAIRRTTLRYDLKVVDREGETIETGQFAMLHKLWKRAEIYDAMKVAGLENLACVKVFDFAKPAAENDWKIMFACRNPASA